MWKLDSVSDGEWTSPFLLLRPYLTQSKRIYSAYGNSFFTITFFIIFWKLDIFYHINLYHILKSLKFFIIFQFIIFFQSVNFLSYFYIIYKYDENRFLSYFYVFIIISKYDKKQPMTPPQPWLRSPVSHGLDIYIGRRGH